LSSLATNMNTTLESEASLIGLRRHFLAGLVLLAVPAVAPRSAAGASEGTAAIALPEPLAVELAEGQTSVSADEEPLKRLIAAAQAPGLKVTAALPQARVGVGVWRVVWTAVDSSSGHPASVKEAYLTVFPAGMTPVGLSGSRHGVVGNNAIHIARDASGFVHMVWTDAYRGADGARYRRARVMPDGSVEFDTGIINLAARPGSWNAIPALAVMGDTVHFTWQADGTARYRSLTHAGTVWRWSDDVDTKAPSPGRDTGAAIVADERSVHILTTSGMYTTSNDGGRTWITEAVPFGMNTSVKTASLTLDSAGQPLAAASVIVRQPAEISNQHGSGAYWTLRIARRVAPGRWEVVPGPLDRRPEWGSPQDRGDDVLADWVRVLEDRTGGMHATWHGTAVSRIYANDRAYYAWRPPGGDWQAPIPLREPDQERGIGWSYAPSLILDGDTALALPFYNVRSGSSDIGFDSDLDLFRQGRRIGPPLPVTRFVSDAVRSGNTAAALSAWYPGAAPALVRTSDGKIWTDVLMTLSPVEIKMPKLIVWRRIDLTTWLTSGARQ
jgi:hypothetical protein